MGEVIEFKKKPQASKKKKRHRALPPVKVCQAILKENPTGIFVLSWDKEGQVTFWSTHGENKADFIKSRLLEALLMGSLHEE